MSFLSDLFSLKPEKRASRIQHHSAFRKVRSAIWRGDWEEAYKLLSVIAERVTEEHENPDEEKQQHELAQDQEDEKDFEQYVEKNYVNQ